MALLIMGNDTPDAALLWEESEVHLAYRFGEFAVGTRRFKALNLRCHFLDLPDDPSQPPPPLERLGRDCEVIATRSHPVATPLPRLERVTGALRYVPSQFSRYYVPLSGTFEEYLAKFSTKTRGTLRRKVRRLLDTGAGSAMRSFSKPDEMPEFHRIARAVSERTYQERLLQAGLPAGKDFLGELEALARKDSVRAYVLTLLDEPIAYLCCPAVNGVLLYSFLGYDPRHADLSPGTVLQYLAFQQLFAEGRFRAFDFTEGQGEHKRFFGTHQTYCADVFYFPATARYRFWIGLHLAFDRLTGFVGRTLDRFGIKQGLKKFLRRHARTG